VPTLSEAGSVPGDFERRVVQAQQEVRLFLLWVPDTSQESLQGNPFRTDSKIQECPSALFSILLPGLSRRLALKRDLQVV
jgi:hypothetical protein